jgi:heme-degrading monooxygenase HmoA
MVWSGSDMGEFYSVRIWQLKPGVAGGELEALMSSGYLEMQRWIPGVKHITLLRGGGDHESCYIVTTTFDNHDAYKYWRQVEEEAADYWERYAAIVMQWEHLCYLVREYTGELVLDTGIDGI